MYRCVHIYIYTHTCTGMYVCMCIYTHTHIYIYAHTHICARRRFPSESCLSTTFGWDGIETACIVPCIQS